MTKFTAYMVIDPMHYDTSYTKSIGHVLTSQKQAIHEFQKAFSAQSDKNMVTRASSYDDSKTKDMAYVVTTDKSYALEMLKAFIASETMNRDTFYTLAEQFSNDMSDEYGENNSDHHFYYDSVEAAKNEYFISSYSAINDWLDSGVLVDGTLSDIIEISVDTTEYYAVLFFEQYNDEAWVVDAREGYIAKSMDDIYKSSVSSTDITYNADLLHEIDVVDVANIPIN